MRNRMSSFGGDVRSRVDADVEAINRARESVFRAFNAADLDAFMAPMADDVVLMDHGGPPPTVGKEVVRSNYKEFFDEGPFIPNLTVSSDEVVVFGDWAFDRGTWVVIRTYKRSVRRERLGSCYIMVWRRQSPGTWNLARIIWNGAPVPIKAGRMGRIRRKSKVNRRK